MSSMGNLRKRILSLVATVTCLASFSQGGGATALPQNLNFADFVGSYQVLSCELKVNNRVHEGDGLCEGAVKIELRPIPHESVQSRFVQGSPAAFELSYLGETGILQLEVLRHIRGQGQNFLERADFVSDPNSAYWIRQYREFPVIYAIDEWREWIPQEDSEELLFIRLSRELWGNDLKIVHYVYRLKRSH